MTDYGDMRDAIDRAQQGADDRIARLEEQRDALVAMLDQAAKRIEIANAEGNAILSAWLPDARALLAKVKS